jgi:hypothetical protein
MKLTLLSFISILLFSCSEYQYFTVSSEQLFKNESNGFVVENDTLKLIYRFNGYHGPIQITIFNKTNNPVEINWRKSALIMHEKAFGYYTPNMVLNGTINQDSLRPPYFFKTRFDADIHADILVNEASQFIPPKSSISKIPLEIPQEYLIQLPENLKKEKLKSSGDYEVKFKREKYGVEHSPINFRSYLTFRFGSNPGTEFSLEHQFYISEIMESTDSPLNFPQELINKGNLFYISESR